MRVGEVWAWRSSLTVQLEPVRLTDVTTIRARGRSVGDWAGTEVDDLTVRFWCPWGQLADYVDSRIEAGVTLRAAQQALTDTLADSASPTAVRLPGEPSPRVVYSLEDAAAECGVSPGFLRDFVIRNNLIAHYANSKPIILAEDLRAWVRSLPEERLE